MENLRLESIELKINIRFVTNLVLLLSFISFTYYFSLLNSNISDSFILILTNSISQSLRMIPEILQKS